MEIHAAGLVLTLSDTTQAKAFVAMEKFLMVMLAAELVRIRLDTTLAKSEHFLILFSLNANS
jgi:hypothetical protein